MSVLALRPPLTRPRIISAARVLLLLALAVAAVLYLGTIRQNLPYYAEVDEETIVEAVAKMLVRGDLNPGWFGHPASTVLYPVFFLTWFCNVVFFGGPLLHGDPQFFAQTYYDHFSLFYLLGRLLTVGYGLMAIPLFYLVGRRLFSAKVALVGIWLSLVYPITIAHAQVVRSDSAGLFFALLSLWLALRYHDQPTVRNRVLAGLAVGLAAASRYFMAFFILPVLIAEFGRMRRLARTSGLGPREVVLGTLGPLAAGLAFALVTPFFFLDFATALESLRTEARGVHLGADGLSPLGNFAWYLLDALPWSITWPQLLLAVSGVALAVRQRRFVPLAAAAFGPAYLIAISIHSLHWERWLIQILPWFALFAASALVWLQEQALAHLRLSRQASAGLLAALLMVLLAVPAYDLALFTLRQARYSTIVQAYRWAIDNLPRGAKIRQDRYALIDSGRYHMNRAGKSFSVRSPGRSVFEMETLEAYQADGVDYIVASSEIYDRIFAEPERYAVEVASYRRLFTDYRLLAEFTPSPVRPGTEQTANRSTGREAAGGGPTLRIYRIGS